jgi:hypothetical protein
MLSTDHDFAAFLASRDLRRLVLEKPVPDFRTIRTRDYDAKTVWCMGVLHPVHVVVPDPVPVAPVAIIPIPRPQFTFTDAQMAIAMAVQARQTLKEAS